MGVRTVAGLALVALLGLGVGWGVGEARESAPVAVDLTPLPASGPAYPRDKRVVVEPDPDFPALARNLPSHREKVGTGPFALSVDIPDGWQRSLKSFGEWGWYPPPGVPTPSNPATYNTYFMRIRLVGNLHQSITEAMDQRIANLRKATGVANFDVEVRTADTFQATYVTDRHLRVTIERFIDSDREPGVAYATIAVVGRQVDRDGMINLLENVTDSALDAAEAEDGPSASASPAG